MAKAILPIRLGGCLGNRYRSSIGDVARVYVKFSLFLGPAVCLGLDGLVGLSVWSRHICSVTGETLWPPI